MEKAKTISYNFTIYTPYGRELVATYDNLDVRFDIFSRDNLGFVRLEIAPPINGMRYVETSYDKAKCEYYTCILEEREQGQGFLEYRSNQIPKRIYRSLLKRKKFHFLYLRRFQRKPTGVQKSVAPEGAMDQLYMEPFEMTSEIFELDGLYGGNQDLPRKVQADSKEGQRIRTIVKKYFPNYNDAQIKAMLNRLWSEGCGYVVGVNMILSHFLGRETEFEQKFGFSMYGEDGELNYNMLMVDYYAATDNHFSNMEIDEINHNEDCMGEEITKPYDSTLDMTGYGTTDASRRYRLSLYLKDKGVKVKVSDMKVITPEEIRALLKKGYVHVALLNGNVQYEDGSTYLYCPGHSMLITGMTADCRYIVSSWGKKYYVDPNEMVERDGKKTSFRYQYYEFV